jgi:hypothetical protein
MSPIGIFYGYVVYISPFGILDHEKSGNPVTYLPTRQAFPLPNSIEIGESRLFSPFCEFFARQDEKGTPFKNTLFQIYLKFAQ